MFQLAEEQPDDWWEVEELFDKCFAPGRESLSSYRLRDGVPPLAHLCLVARDEVGLVAGAIRFWPVRVDRHQALLLGPIAVHPTRQGEGLAAQMIRESIARAGAGARVLLVGDAPYYGRFGFLKLHGVKMPPPTNPERVLGLGPWAGISGRVTAANAAPIAASETSP
ncbi:MAG: N-acetyltransferase [Pseudomonadota bacterium]